MKTNVSADKNCNFHFAAVTIKQAYVMYVFNEQIYFTSIYFFLDLMLLR